MNVGNCLLAKERRSRREFLPETIRLSQWSELEPYFQELIDRPLHTLADLEKMLDDLDELSAAIGEKEARLTIQTSVNTADEAAAEEMDLFQKNVKTRQGEMTFAIVRRFLKSPFRGELEPKIYGHFERLCLNDFYLYNEKNLTIYAEDNNLGNQHSALIGGLKVPFEGKEYNLARMGTYLQDPDRELRERAWRAAANERLKIADSIDDLLDSLIQLRHKIALNAGYKNFRDYQHQAKARFDYTPMDCARFHDSMEQYAVPILQRAQRSRCETLNLERLRPWDDKVDPGNRQPLKPFSNAQQLIDGAATILDSMYPKLGDRLRVLDKSGNLDLETRNNKAMVGYNTVLEESNSSFIFMNSVGYHSDLAVLIHEAGHAIEKSLCKNVPILTYRKAPSEWAELASQSHELVSLDHLSCIYPDKESRDRCVIEAMERLFAFFPRVAQIDSFQHWLYTNPEHTHHERRNYWRQLVYRFGGAEDWTGLESYLGIAWQTIAHIFIVPFYYIEYGIAQLGAIQVWKNTRRYGQEAFDRLLKALACGYSDTITHLYQNAGIRFEFNGPLVGDLLRFIEDEYHRAQNQ